MQWADRPIGHWVVSRVAVVENGCVCKLWATRLPRTDRRLRGREETDDTNVRVVYFTLEDLKSNYRAKTKSSIKSVLEPASPEVLERAEPAGEA